MSTPACNWQSSKLRFHFSLEDYTWFRRSAKKLQSSYKSMLTMIAAAPLCGKSSLVSSGRGVTRKIGCIDIATQMGRKKKIEDDYILSDTIGQRKFGSVCLSKSKVANWNLGDCDIVGSV